MKMVVKNIFIEAYVLLSRAFLDRVKFTKTQSFIVFV
jgi:hypothetical protein